MELELKIDKNHKRANLKEISKRISKKIAINTVLGALSLVLCTGCRMLDFSKDKVDPDTPIDVSSSTCFFSDAEGRHILNDNIKKVKDLEKIYKIKSIDINDDNNVDWLNYCTNLKSIRIIYHSGGKNLEKVDGKNLKKLEEVIIERSEDVENGTELEMNFMKDAKKLTTISYRNSSSEASIPLNIYEMKNLEDLKIDIDFDTIVDYKKLGFLKKLELGGDVYDLPIELSNEDVNYLKSKGVDISLSYSEDESTYDFTYDKKSIDDADEFNKINNELDDIVNSLGVTKESTDTEKLNAILKYVLTNYEYDRQAQNNNVYVGFYGRGVLYGSVKDKAGNERGQICGNYAAMCQALAKRLELESYLINSSDHIFNLMKIDGNYYYIDSTWLDQQEISISVEDNTTEKGEEAIENSDDNTYKLQKITAEDALRKDNYDIMTNFDWYKENPLDYPGIGEAGDSHCAINFPQDINLEINDKNMHNYNTGVGNSTKEERKIEEQGNQIAQIKIKVIIGKNEYEIPGGALVAFLAGIGAIQICKGIKKRKKIKENESQEAKDDECMR